MLQPTPNIVITTGEIEITFIGSSDATDYSVFVSFDRDTTYTEIRSAVSPVIINYDEVLDCGKTVTGYIVANCLLPHPPASGQIKFPDVVIPACPTIDECVDGYQAMVTGNNGSARVVKKISNDGVYNTSDASQPFTMVGGSVFNSVFGKSGFYIIGTFNTAAGVVGRAIGKLDCMGTARDTVFNVGLGFNATYSGDQLSPGSASAIAYDHDLNRIYVGGDFSKYNDLPANNFVALNATTGAIISTAEFNIGTGFTAPLLPGSQHANAPVLSIVVQPDGRILVGGKFSIFNGVAVNYVVRLNINGTRDNTFNVAPFFATNGVSIRDIVIDQPSNSVFLAGQFDKHDDLFCSHVTKVSLISGIKDPVFDVNTNIIHTPNPAGTYVSKILVQGNFIIFTGFFTHYRTTPTNGLIRLDKTTGAQDTTYIKDTTLNINNGYVLRKAPTGDILLGGSFPTGFQGDNLRLNYYILDPADLKINVTKTTTTPPLTTAVLDILIKYTP